jgi:hypothetical protein
METTYVEKVEAQVKEKLIILRRFQQAYFNEKGKYANSWEDLKDYVQNGKFYITDRKEEVITLYYGADSIAVTIDTIGVVGVMDSLFSPKFSKGLSFDELNIVPGTDTNFIFYANVNADELEVVEIMDPKPVNPERQSGELLPLKIGSRERVTLKGSWEK